MDVEKVLLYNMYTLNIKIYKNDHTENGMKWTVNINGRDILASDVIINTLSKTVDDHIECTGKQIFWEKHECVIF